MKSPENRRTRDRRQAERRGPPRSGDSSLFETDPEGNSDSRFIAREALRLVSSEGAALPRILRTYTAARAALSLALVLAPWLASLTGGKPAMLMVMVCLTYAGQAISLWLLSGAEHDRPSPEHLLPRQWLWTIGVDLLAFSMLRLLDPAGQLNYTALLVLPVLMSGVLTRRLVALGTAAGVTLVLLLGVLVLQRDQQDVLLLLSQAGLFGAGLFLVTLLASELSQRLAREERSARSSLELARQQTLLNRVVIEEMADGVLVVDRRGRVRAINPAARQLLGQAGALMAIPAPLDDIPGLEPLRQALEQAYSEGSWPAHARELALVLADAEQRTLQVRARFTRRGGIGADDTPPEDICVLFLEDMRAVQGRARQDKLAAMGRVSAGIAHEIRNPLAAIAQANALLLEDALPPTHLRLSTIVADNVERLKRIVDDVLAVAPGAISAAVTMDATEEVAAVVDEWRRVAPPEARAAVRLVCHWPTGTCPVFFDNHHLRRVLINLLDNASRHAGADDGAVQLHLAPGPSPGQVSLAVASDGIAIPPDVERHLFEPFFSTRSRGSGLGLYICRELCERHGASIDFHLAPATARHRNEFRVVMRAAPSA